jgi:selenocysteine lyase/cysteine desulfurase
VKLYDDAATRRVDSLVGNLLAGVGPKTRVVGLTWVHSSSGMRLPIREMARALKRKHPDVLLVLDGVHGIGAVDETIGDAGADYISRRDAQMDVRAARHRHRVVRTRRLGATASAHPGLQRLGVVQRLDGGTRAKGPTTAARMTPGGFHAFEHQWAMKAAFEMHEAMGRARVAGRIRELNDRLKTQLADIRRSACTRRSPGTCRRDWWRSRSTE